MNFNANVGIGAVFKLIVRKADTDEIVRETPEFHNLVLNTGLAQMAVGTWINRCCVGTGNSVPVPTQVSLDSFLASTTTEAAGTSNTGGIQVTTEPFYWFGRITWRFAVGVATGNISEIGLGWGNATLWNRALVKDTAGNPTTITVLADEYLDVISEVRVYPKTSTGSFNVVDKVGAVISAHTYKAVPKMFANNAGFYSGLVNYFAGYETGSAIFGIGDTALVETPTTPITALWATRTLTSNVYSGNTLTSKMIISSSDANFPSGVHRTFATALGGLMCGAGSNLSIGNTCGYKWEVTPPIPKNAETVLTYSFTLAWGNYVPE